MSKYDLDVIDEEKRDPILREKERRKQTRNPPKERLDVIDEEKRDPILREKENETR